ncbi:MAG TPA: ATP-binding cassette domain-containing protein [Cellulomonas sp.]
MTDDPATVPPQTDAPDAWLARTATPAAGAVRAAAALRVAGTAATVVQWWGVAALAQRLIDSAGTGPLLASLALVVAAGAAGALATWAAARWSRIGAERIAAAARRDLLGSVLPGDGVRAALDPAVGAEALLGLIDQVAEHLAQHAPRQRSAGASMLLIFVATAVVHWPAAVILVLATAIVPANMWLAGMLAKDGNDRYLHALDRLGAIVLDSFRGIRTLRRLRALDGRSRTIEQASARLQRANLAVLRRAFVSGVVMDTVVTMSIAVAATYVGMALLGYVHVPGTALLSLRAGLFVLLLCPAYFTPLREAAAGFHDRERTLAAARSLTAMRAPAPARPTADVLTVPVTVVAGDLEVRSPGGQLLVRAGGTLTAPARRWTVITGASGAGKTTLLTVLSGLRTADSGAVRWLAADGSDLGQVLPGAATWIGQSSLVVTGTLADNLRLGAAQATDAELVAALRAVGLGPLLDALPDGLATVCGGQDGYAFSAGEVRRIAVARATLRGSRLWLLDEPTAHLDDQAQHEVVEALRTATRGCTVIVVTHSAEVARLATSRIEVTDGAARQHRVADGAGARADVRTADGPAVAATGSHP